MDGDATMDQEIERKVRERAYAIWEQEGRPDGQHLKHWERAKQLVVTEVLHGRSKPVVVATATPAVEEGIT